MNENRTPETTSTMERRARRPESSIWAEILTESAWRPQDKPRESDGWLRAHGYLPDRRQGA